MFNNHLHRFLPYLLTLVGLWPVGRISQKWRGIYKIYTVVPFWMYAIFTFLQFAEFAQIISIRDPRQITEIIIFLYVTVLYKVKIIKSKDMRKLFRYVYLKEKQIEEGDYGEFKDILQSYSDEAKLYSEYFMRGSLITYLTFSITCTLQFLILWDTTTPEGRLTRPLPLRHYVFLDKTITYKYYILYVYDCVIGLVTSFFYITTNSLIILLMCFSIGQLKILQSWFKKSDVFKEILARKYRISMDEASYLWIKMGIMEYQQIIG
ncbi:unnamed protein product [Brassicogethes aeneus]|uniref:Odorant receptor n=1 Tax=Brassicogethes aeneus TaxID=1431903 RepID=A0A9P0BE60_BRAAE|nr:unnamed protein product [Brassicogethes aeneus]